MSDDPERSSIEIKTLLRKLDPKYGNKHSDRIRRLEKFRTYVTGKNFKTGTTPEFYDDDFSLLMLGSDSPHAVYDADLQDLKLYSLLKSCGEPSTDHLHMLKRSAKSAMALLKFLVVDYMEMKNGEVIPPSIDSSGAVELNGFAHALCTCAVPQLKAMNLEMHVCGAEGGDTARGGSKEDACEIIILLITRHLDLDGITPKPLAVDELLSTANARKAFDTWLVANKGRDVQQAVKKATIAADSQNQQAHKNDLAGDDDDGNVLNAFSKKKKKKRGLMIPEDATEEEVAAALQAAGHAEEQLDQLGLNLYNKNDLEQYEDDSTSGPATRWADSQLARQQIQLSAQKDHADGGGALSPDTDQDEEEKKRRRQTEQERLKLLTRDPLSIKPDDFDLRTVQARSNELMEHALMEIEEQLEQEEDIKFNNSSPQNAASRASITTPTAIGDGNMDSAVSMGAQRAALEAVLEKMQNEQVSILPTDVHFDPLLFLTLVHRYTGFDDLAGSIERLSSKTDNHMQRQQSIVRDNFALFVRCAEGIDIVSEQTADNKSGKRGVKQQLNRLDALANTCSEQAKKSFKPLLDNTNEVRKVQSALAVLQRVGPLIQTPNLMRQHIEENRFSDAVKAYRRVLVIDDDCNIALLRHVKAKAAEAAREARKDLEATLANSAVPVSNLLDAIRDLGELIELAVPTEQPTKEGKKKKNKKSKDRTGGGGGESKENSTSGGTKPGVFCVGNREINVRDHPPALACLLLQSAYFSSLVDKSVRQAENSTERIYRGESISILASEDASATSGASGTGEEKADDGTASTTPSTVTQNSVDNKSTSAESGSVAASSSRTKGNKRWKYDVLEARVIATIRVVAIARNWLPRLLRIGVAAREAEKRRAARIGGKRKSIGGAGGGQDDLQDSLTAFEVFLTNISPAIARLTEHATFCALGCSNNSAGEELTMSFGYCAEERLQTLLRAPLPPAQSAKCAQELASLVEVVHNCTTSANMLRPAENDIDGNAGGTTSHYKRISLESPLEECTQLAEEAVVTVERRVCIYSFDVCARNCSMRASGSGTFDGDALLLCVQKLSEELTRPEECSNEVEKGCELVVRRCCEGLASYVRDRGDAARLRVVAECADALNGRIVDVVRQVAYLTNGQCEAVEEALAEDIMALEGTMFDDFLDNVRRHVAGCARLCWNDFDPSDDGPIGEEGSVSLTTFPAYLSASLLAIVRCRAQVERALRETTIRRSEGMTYQFLAMATAADGVVDGICNELNANMSRVHGRQADRMANELQFLINTLKNYLSDEMLGVADKCRRMLCSKAGRGSGIQGGGPDGLGAIEDLERLGRVYVLCLGE